MAKKTQKIAKSVGMGLAVGAAVATVAGVAGAKRNGKGISSMKKSAGKTMMNVSEFIGDVSKMLR